MRKSIKDIIVGSIWLLIGLSLVILLIGLGIIAGCISTAYMLTTHIQDNNQIDTTDNTQTYENSTITRDQF